MTITSGEINLQSKRDIICHVAKVKPATSAHYLADVIPFFILRNIPISLRSWRDFVREWFCFGSEAVNAIGEAVRGLVKSRVEFPPAQISGVFWIMRSPVHTNFGLAESTETSIKC